MKRTVSVRGMTPAVKQTRQLLKPVKKKGENMTVDQKIALERSRIQSIRRELEESDEDWSDVCNDLTQALIHIESAWIEVHERLQS